MNVVPQLGHAHNRMQALLRLEAALVRRCAICNVRLVKTEVRFCRLCEHRDRA
jgi:hypothetical protein